MWDCDIDSYYWFRRFEIICKYSCYNFDFR